MPAKSRVWFVTGTSSGLGKALVETLLKISSTERVVATCRNPEVHSTLSSQYSTDRLLVRKLDVTKAEDIRDAFKAAIDTFGRVDVVVNNAGYAFVGEIEAIPEEDARHQFEVQFWGPVSVTKEAIRVFREVNPKGEGGRVFNISTIGGYMANPTLAYYSASKFALESFTESFIKEMAPEWNITGCIIEPGGFNSEWRGASQKNVPPHPAYTDPNNPCAKFRQIHEMDGMTFLGDAHKMAEAIYKLADEPELPLRVQFGSEALFLIKSQALKTANEADKFAHIAHSTNRDGMDGEKYVRDIVMASGSFDRNKNVE